VCSSDLGLFLLKKHRAQGTGHGAQGMGRRANSKSFQIIPCFFFLVVKKALIILHMHF
jgi:hypothetical protein